MNLMKLRNNLTIILILVGMIISARADSTALHNYNDDPNLSLAMEYDIGETTHRSKANRELAEKYYLEYLKKDIPSFQKARIYIRLGVLYSVGSDPKRGIKPDYEKAQKYLEKALEFEPERIDPVTIMARTLLASLPIIPAEERIRKRLDIYGWLCSLDDSKYEELWLPLEPNQEQILRGSFKQLQNLVPSLKRCEAKNIVSSASSKPNREELLLMIIQRFPNEEIADMARQKLKLPADKVADEALASLDGEFDAAKITDNNVQENL